MAKAITVKVTDKTDFDKYDALNLGDVMTFDGLGVYTYPDGSTGTYDQPWLEQMLDSGAFAEVLSERSFRGQDAPEWATAVGCFLDSWYWEEDINQPNGARFENITGKRSLTYDKHTKKGWDQYKILPSLVEEQLPPAPDSVLYIKDNGVRKLEACIDAGRVLLRIELNVNHLQCNSRGYGLSPDDALQLAHDIRRMAMDIKRKQKEVK